MSLLGGRSLALTGSITRLLEDVYVRQATDKTLPPGQEAARAR
jgi:hypothetical protein